MEGGPQEEIKSDKAEHTVDDDQENFCLDQVAELTQDQEADLAAFLLKVQKACGEDKSVPKFVGAQVDEWIKELDEKKVESKSDGMPETQ